MMYFSIMNLVDSWYVGRRYDFPIGQLQGYAQNSHETGKSKRCQKIHQVQLR